MKRVFLITGGNRGIGFELVRVLSANGDKVYFTCRNEEDGKCAMMRLSNASLNARFLIMDITDERSVYSALEQFSHEENVLDVLINNAGGYFDMTTMPSKVDKKFIMDAMELNLIGAWTVTRVFIDKIRNSKAPRIVNVSSSAGLFSDPAFGFASGAPFNSAYCLSKLALNGLTRKLAAEFADTNIMVNSVCPGFTASHPSLEKFGARPIGEGAASILFAANLKDDGPRGKFLKDGKEVDW